MEKLFTWLKESDRYKHLLGGIAIGAFANSFYCASYAGIGVATALELKDKMWGGKFDLVDLSLTLAGVAIGYGVRIMII
nr:MAG TPA: putative periplasmic lipoprotein [Caudoviricetes sp.]